MIYSMTGYGLAEYENEKASLSIEIRTLNSKFLDLQIKLPKELNEREIEIRKIISDALKRGKVALTLDIKAKTSTEKSLGIDTSLLTGYYKELSAIATGLGLKEHPELFKIALNMPEVFNTEEASVPDISWEEIVTQLTLAIDQCNDFRRQEGNAIAEKLGNYVSSISYELQNIDKIDPARVEKIKTRIASNLEEFLGSEHIDKNRFEQEMIYYIEKLDISEEKVRLQNHLEYFKEVITNENFPGKKLAFVSQEIGREINTIGSKANDAIIQRHVVIMKEELEKIKEQLLNIV